MGTIFLQSDNQLITFFQELFAPLVPYLMGSPLGSILAFFGFSLIVLSQVNLRIPAIFEYEHRGNSRVSLYTGILVFILGMVFLVHNYYRVVSYVPSVFGSEDNIESIYASVLAKEFHSRSREMEVHFEDSLRSLDRFIDIDSDKSELEYFKAKIAYKYASALLENGDYAKASQFFSEAFFLYESDRNSFDKKSDLDRMRSPLDFRFDINKAYDSLLRSAYSNVLRANSFRDEKDRLEFLHKAKIQVDKILVDHLGGDAEFRSSVWFAKGEIHEKLGIDDYFRFYVYSFMADENNGSAVEKIAQAGAFDAEGRLNFSPEVTDELISSAPVSISPAIGGYDPVQMPEMDFSEDVDKNAFLDLDANPFFSYTFPMNRCGDSKPLNASDYPWALNPVYVDYTEESLLRIKASYCKDAFHSRREGKIQVASFSEPEMGHYFDEFLRFKLGSSVVETGAKHIYCTINSRKPLILASGQTIEELCST